MTFTKQIAPARKIDAFRSFEAQVKYAYVSPRDGSFLVTEMQTNSDGIDCQWTAATAAQATSALLSAGYVIEAA